MKTTQQEIDDQLLDGVNSGHIIFKNGKFQAKQWCQLCRGHSEQHFCECGEEISSPACESQGGFCSDCFVQNLSQTF